MFCSPFISSSATEESKTIVAPLKFAYYFCRNLIFATANVLSFLFTENHI